MARLNRAKIYLHPSVASPNIHARGAGRQAVVRATLLFALREAGYLERSIENGKRYAWEVAA